MIHWDDIRERRRLITLALTKVKKKKFRSKLIFLLVFVHKMMVSIKKSYVIKREQAKEKARKMWAFYIVMANLRR